MSQAVITEAAFYSINDMMALYNVSRQTIWRWHAQDRIPKKAKMPGHAKWRKDVVDRHLKSR